MDSPLWMRRMASERIMLMSTVLILGHWSFWISCGMVLVTTTCESQETEHQTPSSFRAGVWFMAECMLGVWRSGFSPSTSTEQNRIEQSQTWKTEQIQPMSWLHLQFTLLGGLSSPTASEVYCVQDLLFPTAPASIRAKLLKLQDLMTSFLSVLIQPIWRRQMLGKMWINGNSCSLLVGLEFSLPQLWETWLLKGVLWLHEHPHSHARHTQNRYRLILKDVNNPSFQRLRKR